MSARTAWAPVALVAAFGAAVGSLFFAGAGVKAGTVVGGTDGQGADVRGAPVSPADVVATACPFCSQMLGSASGSSAGLVPGESDGQGAAGSGLPQVRDVAVMLLEAVRRGQDGRAPEGD